jgi:hypothetical protein
VLQSSHRVRNLELSGSDLERSAEEGNSPVDEKLKALRTHPSTTGHEESRGN